VLVGPGRDPHTYEPTPRQVAALHQAGIYFPVGMPFERAWVPRIESANPGLRVVDLSEGLPPLERQAGKPGPHEPSDEDPHAWSSPVLVKAMAAKIRETLADLDSAHGSEYAANEAAFARDLDTLDRDIRKTLAPIRGRTFMVFHPAWGAFARTYGLRQIAVEAEGKDPGPRTLANLIALARSQRIGTIFVQEQFSRRSAQIVAEAIGARVVALDPLAENYLANMRTVAGRIAEALKGP
jgi:zinc transport system substrate-binding protein